jgi:hypothetical protein
MATHPYLTHQLVVEHRADLRCEAAAARRPARLPKRLPVLVVLAIAATLIAGNTSHPSHAAPASTGPASIPAAARGPVSAMLGNDDPRYAVKHLEARNPASG